MDLFTEFELLIMISTIGGLLFLIFILLISEFISRKKEIKEEMEELEELEITKKFMAFKDIDDEVKVEVKEELKELDVVNELSKESEVLIEELEEIEPVVVKVESNLEVELNPREKAQIELLKIEDELENPESLEDTITNLETIEEENAIISYQELLNNTGELDMVLTDDGDEPITISEVFKMFNEQKNDNLNILDEIDKISKREDMVITNLEGNDNLNAIQLENTANLEKLDKELRKTNEVLTLLNQLKKNLD